MFDTQTAHRQLQYEGFPLEAVLARVHAAHGADVTITGADRVRRGGIGGFFARELFQVTVTVPNPGGAERSGGDDEPEHHFHQLGPMSIFGDEVSVIGDEPDYDDIDPEDIAGAMSLDPAPARDDADVEIWALLAAAATASPPVATPALPAPATHARRAPERPALERPTTEHLAPELVEPIRAGGPIASTTLIPATLIPTTPVPAAAMPAPSSRTAPSRPAPLPVNGVAGTPFDPAWNGLPVVTQLAPSAEAPPGPVALRSPGAVDLDQLIARFEHLPAPPDVPHAGVIAVIGARGEALAAAGGLADRLGIPTDDVIVASPPADIVVPSTEDAMRLAASTRYRCAPVAVIVVELVPGRQGHEWVRVVLEGLRAEQVRYAADAARLIGHQGLSVGAVGGVDVIDLLGAAGHRSPDEVLALPTPVGTIDGRVATPELWAATVLAGQAAVPADDRPLQRNRSVVS